MKQTFKQIKNKSIAGYLKSSILKGFKLATMAICTIGIENVKAQIFQPATSLETFYPNAAMTPTSLNLHPLATQYLSNFSFPGTGPFSGSSIELTGWSTPSNGGFSYGTSTSGTYSGIGAVTIANAKDVQVGLLEFGGGNEYVVASYYDVSESLYGYNLYKWNFLTGSMTKLYSYHFPNPTFLTPAFVPNTIYHPIPYMPSYPCPTKKSTMGYNRISMDISQNADKVAIVLTDNTDGSMYTAVGMVAMDTIMFSPNLPKMREVPGVYTSLPGTSSITIGTPQVHYPYPGSYTINTSGDYDFFDGCIYARYFPASGKYWYSYFPIAENTYITEYEPSAGTVELLYTTGSGNYNFSPLIRLQAVSTVTTPCLNPYYKQYWPDVALSGDIVNFLFYSPELSDLYVGNDPFSSSFSFLYSYTGHPSPGVCGISQTDMPIASFNTVDNRPISNDYISGIGHLPGLESACQSLPLTSSVPEIRAKLDAPDMAHSDWALTFAYKPDNFYDIAYPRPGTSPLIYTVHPSSEVGKNNIYVRSNYIQSVLTNGSMGNSPVNTQKNFNPTIAYKPMSPSNVSVAWVCEKAGIVSGTTWAYIGVEMHPTLSSLYTINDYLHLANNPGYSSGSFPLVSLSKYTHGLSGLNTNFTQQNPAGTYSVQHKNRPWTSVSTWRTTSLTTATSFAISVGPNPFIDILRINASGLMSVNLSDITGRIIGNYNGNQETINKQLDAVVGQLSVGMYLLHVTPEKGNTEVFKLNKQ